MADLREQQINDLRRKLLGQCLQMGIAHDAIDALCDQAISAPSRVPDGVRGDPAIDELHKTLCDAHSGWKYIRETHGDLYGVGWDRVEKRLWQQIVESAKRLRTLAPPQAGQERAVDSFGRDLREENLAMMIRRCAHKLDKDDPRRIAAYDLLERMGLSGSPLRAEQAGQEAGAEIRNGVSFIMGPGGNEGTLPRPNDAASSPPEQPGAEKVCQDGACLIAEARGEHCRCENGCAYAEKIDHGRS